MELERNRNEALVRISQQSAKGDDVSKVDTGEFRYLNPTDLQNIKDRGEAALQEMIRSREIELERQRRPDREL